jgi:hypothetical protein
VRARTAAAFAVCAQAAEPAYLEAVTIAFTLFILGRVFEEALQICRDGLHYYLGSFWNRVDILMLILQSTAIVLRVCLSFMGDGDGNLTADANATTALPPSLTPPSASDAFVYMPAGWSATPAVGHHTGLQQIQFDFQVRPQTIRDWPRVHASSHPRGL